jgi:hypothetical protein
MAASWGPMAAAGSSDLFLVDVVQVTDADAETYRRELGERGIAVMTAAGAAFESCRSTLPGLGPVVDIEVVWRLRDLAHWNRVRRNLVLDPAWYAWSRQTTRLRQGGTRRFMEDAAPGPPR